MKRFFYDENSEKLLSMEELEKLFSEYADSETTFAEWFENCQSRNNGSLTEYYKFSMTVIDDETETAFDLVAIGSNPENAIVNFCVEHEMDYTLIPVSYRKIEW